MMEVESNISDGEWSSPEVSQKILYGVHRFSTVNLFCLLLYFTTVGFLLEWLLLLSVMWEWFVFESHRQQIVKPSSCMFRLFNAPLL